MSFYQDASDGTVNATMLLAVPRSVSSALGRALSCSPDCDVYLFQPFYQNGMRPKDFDAYITKAVNDKQANPENPLNVTMKVMAESVTGRRFAHLMKASKNICVLVRDPQSQALSVFRAYHDLESGQDTGADELQKLKAMEDTQLLLRDYLVRPWQSMEQHLKQLEAANGASNWDVVEGDVIRSSPEMMLTRLCRDFGIKFTPDMIGGWNAGADKTIGLKENNYHASWLGRLQETTGLKKPACMTPRLEDFSKSMRPQVEANLRTYVHILASKHLMAPAPAELRRMMDEDGFHHTSPIACYTLASLWQGSASFIKDQALAKIRKEEPQFSSSYALIDATVAKEVKRATTRRSTGVAVSK